MFFINIKLRRDYRNTLVAADHKGSCQNLRHHRIFRHHRHHFFILHECSRMRVSRYGTDRSIFSDIDNELSLNFRSAIRSFGKTIVCETSTGREISPHGCVPTARTELFPKLTSALPIPFSSNSSRILASAYPFPYPPRSMCKDSEKKMLLSSSVSNTWSNPCKVIS